MSVITIGEVKSLLASEHRVECSESTLRRRIDAMGLSRRAGPLRIIDRRNLGRLAKDLRASGYATEPGEGQPQD